MREEAVRTGRLLASGLHANWRPLLLAHVAWSALALAVLMPLAGLTLRGLLALGGRSVVADQDIAWFIISPLGLVSLVAVVGLVVAIAAIEQAAMLAIVAPAGPGRSIGWFAGLRFAVARALRVLRFAWRLVLRVLAVVLPFLVAAASVVWLLVTEHDINFYLASRPPEFLLAAVVIGAIALAMAALLLFRLAGWALALPLLLFHGASPTAAFRDSERLVAGHRWHVAGVLLVWSLTALAISAIVAGATGAIGSWLLPQFFDSIRRLVAALGVVVVLGALGALFAGAVSLGGFALAIMALYRRFGPAIAPATLASIAAESRPAGGEATPLRVVALVAVVAGLAVVAGAWLLAGAQVPDAAVVVAHRGAAGRAPENTMASVRAAIEDRADWIEIDVQETADGEVVVLHDSDFMKLAGVPLKIWEGRLEQVTAIDVGSRFAPEFAGERVPTLAAVLEEVGASDSGLVIELKYYGHDQELERRVVEQVERAGMADRVAIMSLKQEGIRKVRSLRPEWKLGLLAARAFGDLARVDADFLAVNLGMARPRFIRHAHAAGKKVFVWTVNDPVTMSRVLSLGVDGVITDEPAMARKVIAERASLSVGERLAVHAAVVFGKPLPTRGYRDESP